MQFEVLPRGVFCLVLRQVTVGSAISWKQKVGWVSCTRLCLLVNPFLGLFLFNRILFLPQHPTF